VAVELMVAQLDAPDMPPKVVRMPSQLIVRNSTTARDPRLSAVAVDGREHGKR
jgi:hypothetical protein